MDEGNEASSKTVTKLEGFQFYKQTLQGAVNAVAPMVDQSELAWRMLSRRHNAHLCYTPMLHAQIFTKDPTYRNENLQTCPEDRPLIVQFCANEPETLLKAAKMCEDKCDAIDLNLGCPQAIAKRGHYGAFLQDEWRTIEKILSLCNRELKIPITAKCRVFDSIEKTVEYAKMLERAGAQLLTVHGRTRDQKGPNTGLASWRHIKAVREAISIPMFANGNIQYLEDVHRCIDETGVQGVMIAEGSLHNPALFDGRNPPVWELVSEYLDMVDKYPCSMTYVRGHIFKMCIHSFDVYNEYRMKMGECKNLSTVRTVMNDFFQLLQNDERKHRENPDEFNFKNLRFPYWICQPYVRPGPDTPAEERKTKFISNVLSETAEIPEQYKGLSKKKLKKALRHPELKVNQILKPGRPKFEFCVECSSNARGTRCDSKMCKTCCKLNCRTNQVCCKGHYFIHPPAVQRTDLPVNDITCNKKPRLERSAPTIDNNIKLSDT